MAHWQKFLLGTSLALVISGPLYANPSEILPVPANEELAVAPSAPPQMLSEPAASSNGAPPAVSECADVGGLIEDDKANISFFYPFPVAAIAPDSQALRATSEGGVMLVNGMQYTLQYIELPKHADLPFSSVQYPMEARFVHRAADGSTVILSVPVTEGKANIALEKMLQAKSTKIDPNDLLPADRAIALMGQTKQGCTGPVEKHYVMTTPVQVSAAQIKKFEQLF